MPGGLRSRVSRVVLTTDAVGGVWQYSLDLARGLARHEIETTLVVLGPRPSEAQRASMRGIASLRLVESGLPLEWTADDPLAFREVKRSLADLVSHQRPDVVHLNAPALAEPGLYDAPVIVVAHSCVATWWRAVRSGAMPDDFQWRSAATRQGLESADQIVAATDSFAAALRETYGRDLDIAVVPNGRSDPRIRREKRRLVLTAGRLWDDGKNAAMLDRAAAHIDAPVFAAGPVAGPEGSAARFSHLSLLGTLDDETMAAWHASAAVFASAARYEPFGLAVLEAAQAGAALVLSDIPSFRELWDGAAVFVAADDERGWVEALRMLLDAGEGARRWGAAAQARARRYSAEAMVAGTLDAYQRARTRREARLPALCEAG
jgi:glycogen(starch) synthase